MERLIESIFHTIRRKERLVESRYVGKTVYLVFPERTEEKVEILSVDKYGFVYKSVSTGKRYFVNHQTPVRFEFAENE